MFCAQGLAPRAIGAPTNTWLAGGPVAYPTVSNVLYLRTGLSCHRCTYLHLVGWWVNCLPDIFQCFVRKDWPPRAIGAPTNTWLAGGSVAYLTFSNVLYVRTGPSCHRCADQHLVGWWASCLPDSFQCFVGKDWPLINNDHRCADQHLVGRWASCLPDSFQCFVGKDWPLMP